MPIFSAYLISILDKKIPKFISEFVENLKYVLDFILFFFYQEFLKFNIKKIL